ncbi:MAG: right-handed parallel beta-helix repeat-containing protein [Parafilimonas sp.]
MATYTVKAGSTGGTYKAGDIVNFEGGNYTYFILNGYGTKDDPIQLNFKSPVTFKNGFDITNAGGFIMDGGVNKNLLIKDASGVPLSFKGKCRDVEIKGIVIDGAYSWLWFKTEVGEYTSWDYWTKNADGTISPNYVMDGLKLSNFDFKNAKFDGCYIGSTGQQADRAVVIDGKIYYPLPAKVANIQIENGTMDGAARTGMQISGLLNGINHVKNVAIKNCGKSLENYQGACFLIGGNSPADIEIDGNTFDGSNLYAVRTDGGGEIKFTNNVVANSNKVNGVIRPTKMAAVQFDGVKPQTKLIITGNTIDASNNGVSIVVYGDKNTVSAESIIANNRLAGQFQNFSGVDFKEEGTTTPPPVDTDPIPPVELNPVTLKSVTHTFTYTDGSKKEVSGCQYAARIKDGNWLMVHNDGSTEVIQKSLNG